MITIIISIIIIMVVADEGFSQTLCSKKIALWSPLCFPRSSAEPWQRRRLVVSKHWKTSTLSFSHFLRLCCSCCRRRSVKSADNEHNESWVKRT